MKPDDHIAESVWQHTLSQVRTTKRRRQHRRIAVAATSCCVLLGSWLTLRPRPHAEDSRMATVQPVPPVATLAVMRISPNGSVRLEELSARDLGSIELSFGLEPVVTSDP